MKTTEQPANTTIHFPSAEESEAELKQFFAKMGAVRKRQNIEIEAARLALPVLIDCCRNHTGQSYKVRAFLFSLWNGKPASLLELVTMDYELREHLGHVFLAFGRDEFFYEELTKAFKDAGLFDWFTNEAEVQS